MQIHVLDLFTQVRRPVDEPNEVPFHFQLHVCALFNILQKDAGRFDGQILAPAPLLVTCAVQPRGSNAGSTIRFRWIGNQVDMLDHQHIALRAIAVPQRRIARNIEGALAVILKHSLVARDGEGSSGSGGQEQQRDDAGEL